VKQILITNNANFKVLEIKSPWPDSQDVFKYVLISAENAMKTTFMRDAYDGIIITPIKNIVVTSTTHIPALELLGVVAFGVDGKSKSLNTVKKANIPVIYNGDWVEKTPLAKAEWIKLFGALYNKDKQADSIFNQIVIDYKQAKTLAQNAKTKPSILSGAMHKEQIYGLVHHTTQV